MIRPTTETFRLSLPRECDSRNVGINNSSWRMRRPCSASCSSPDIRGTPGFCLHLLPSLISCDNFHLLRRAIFVRPHTTVIIVTVSMVIGFTGVVRLTKISWQKGRAQRRTCALPRELIMRENNIIEGIIGCKAKLQRECASVTARRSRCCSFLRRVNAPHGINH